MLELVAHSGPMQDPLLAKLESKHITKALEVAERRIDKEFLLKTQRLDAEAKTNKNILIFLSGMGCLGFGVVWLFLQYGKTDQVFQLLAMVFTGGGGIGIGAVLFDRRRKPDSGDALIPSSSRNRPDE